MASLIMMAGALTVAGGAATTYMLPDGLETMLPSIMNLKESGPVYPMFMKPPFKLRSTYHVFEVKNRNAFLNGSKLIVGLKGPFYYDTGIERANVQYKHNGESIKYDSKRNLVLDEKNSADLDEKLWLLNPILIGMQASIKKMVIDKVPFKSVSEPIVFNSVNLFLDQFGERLVVRKSARELLEGTKVEMLEFLTNSADRFGLKSMMPPGPANNIFGIAYQQNETIETQEIWAGIGSTQGRYGEVISFNDKTTLNAWRGQCNKLEGTNGEIFKGFIKPNQTIRVFMGALCRTFDLEPLNQELVNGLTTIEYRLSTKLFMGRKTRPSNECFCVNRQSYDCVYDGFMPMGPCFFDSPLFFSRPDFSTVDPKILGLLGNKRFDDLKVKGKSRQSMFLEPTTGTPARVDLSLISWFKVVRQPYMRDMSKLPALTYAPTFMASEFLELPPAMTGQLKVLQMAYNQPGVIGGGTAIAGSALFLVGMMRRFGAASGSAGATGAAAASDSSSGKPFAKQRVAPSEDDESSLNVRSAKKPAELSALELEADSGRMASGGSSTLAKRRPSVEKPG